MSKTQFDGSRKSSLLPINGSFGEKNGRNAQYAVVSFRGSGQRRMGGSSSIEPKLSGNIPRNILKTLDMLESL